MRIICGACSESNKASKSDTLQSRSISLQMRQIRSHCRRTHHSTKQALESCHSSELDQERTHVCVQIRTRTMRAEQDRECFTQSKQLSGAWPSRAQFHWSTFQLAVQCSEQARRFFVLSLLCRRGFPNSFSRRHVRPRSAALAALFERLALDAPFTCSKASIVMNRLRKHHR